MRLIACLLLLTFTTGRLNAEPCQGQDLVAAMAPAVRAELQRETARDPYGEGLLWQADKPGHRLYLFGTFHLYDPRFAAMQETVLSLLAKVDRVYVESQQDEAADLQTKITTTPGVMFPEDQPTLPEMLSEQEWAHLSGALRARGMPPALASKIAPWLVNLTIALPTCVQASVVKGRKGLDGQITAEAAARALPIQSLDDIDLVLAILTGDALGTQINGLRVTIAGLPQAENAFVTMQAQYLREAHREIWEFSRHLSKQAGVIAPEEVDALLDEVESQMMAARNRHWLETLLAAPAKGTALVAVGALHLGGASGLLALLDQAGYQLTRLPLH